MGTHEKWVAKIRARFADRAILPRQAALDQFGVTGPHAEVREALQLIESEYDLPAGFLRPEDRLEFLFDPVEAGNPLEWLLFRGKTEDRRSELEYRLSKRVGRAAFGQFRENLATIGDYVLAWCSGGAQRPR